MLKTARVPVMFERSLVEKVDEWSFSNKVRTRAEAIRQLVRVGLTIETIKNETGEAQAS